jgi:hypothetical protein
VAASTRASLGYAKPPRLRGPPRRRGIKSAREAQAFRAATVRLSPDAGPKEVKENAQDSEGRHGEDHARRPGQLSAANHDQDYDDRVQMEGLTLHMGGEEVALLSSTYADHGPLTLHVPYEASTVPGNPPRGFPMTRAPLGGIIRSCEASRARAS